MTQRRSLGRSWGHPFPGGSTGFLGEMVFTLGCGYMSDAIVVGDPYLLQVDANLQIAEDILRFDGLNALDNSTGTDEALYDNSEAPFNDTGPTEELSVVNV